ncbi:MAG: LarC family nickel insertion protein [Clostridiales bacterium]|jgi:uncharacterized protein (DUF111 family)|nr:LarC family nickel insertion protein [Clostridiales bacterium]
MVDSPLGPIRCKFSQGAGLSKTKLEYEDLARLATDNDLTLSEVRELAAKIPAANIKAENEDTSCQY